MVCDLSVVTLAWFFAYWVRFNTDFIEVEKGIPPFQNYLALVLFIWPIWAFVFRQVGLYRPMRGVRRAKELWMLVNGNVLAVLMFIALTYLFREKTVPFSRLVFVYFLFFATLFTAIERGLLRFLLREVRRRGYNLRYVLIVGAGKLAGDVAARIRAHPELGIQVLGCLSRDGNDRRGPAGMTVIGSYADLPRLLGEMNVDQLLVSLPLEDNVVLPEVMATATNSTVDVRIVPDLHQFVNLGGAIEEFEGLPIINLQASPIAGINLVNKRCFDAVVAGLILVAVSPLLLVIAVLVRLTSRGPIIYAQERVSVDGTRFQIFKFRTMYCDSECQGPGWTRPDDQRVTPIGRVLRSLSLDELPQLVNVIRGDMSLVGPRPERPVFIEEFRKRIPKYMLRHKVPAGLTGWAQVHGWRGDTSIDKRIEYDLYYIENWSLLLDVKILLLTLLRGWRDRNAY